MVIEPIFEADFCGTSYGFRPKRSAHDAVDDVAHTLNRGYKEVIDADLSKYFDTIPHADLMAVVAKRISDGEILRLIKMWLKAPIMEDGKDGKKRNIGGGKGSRKGTPQGGVISPLLPAPTGQDMGEAAVAETAGGTNRPLRGRYRNIMPLRHQTSDGNPAADAGEDETYPE